MSAEAVPPTEHLAEAVKRFRSINSQESRVQWQKGDLLVEVCARWSRPVSIKALAIEVGEHYRELQRYYRVASLFPRSSHLGDTKRDRNEGSMSLLSQSGSPKCDPTARPPCMICGREHRLTRNMALSWVVHLICAQMRAPYHWLAVASGDAPDTRGICAVRNSETLKQAIAEAEGDDHGPVQLTIVFDRFYETRIKTKDDWQAAHERLRAYGVERGWV